MPTVNGVAKTALYINDLERAGRFYEEVLDLRPLMAEDRMRVYSTAHADARWPHPAA